MANVATTIRRISVDFKDETTEVYVYIKSTEPENPFWGNGCRHHSYPKEIPLENILPEIADYLNWEIVCPTCHGPKERPADTGFCGDVYHVDSGTNLLGIFDEDVTAPV